MRRSFVACSVLAFGTFAVAAWRLSHAPGSQPAAVNGVVGRLEGPLHQLMGPPAPERADGPIEAPMRGFRIPTGHIAALSCDAARSIVAQVRGTLAYDAPLVAPRHFAQGVADWLDPHGLWSASPDAPLSPLLLERAADLLAELEQPQGGDCSRMRELGSVMVDWVDELRELFDEAASATNSAPEHESWSDSDGSGDSTFETGTVIRPGRAFAALLGERVSYAQSVLGLAVTPYSEVARARFFPSLSSDQWGDALLAAAIRAYVPLVDPHGAWAPLDEESSVYEVDLEEHPPRRFWERLARAPLGIRIDGAVTPPLMPGDIVLSFAGMTLAGLSVEQIDQLELALAEEKRPFAALVWRTVSTPPDPSAIESKGATLANELLELTVRLPDEPEAVASATRELPVERVGYGSGDVLVVTIGDVRDGLGSELGEALILERNRGGRPIEGVVLDLRGNGGGSTDGAIDALGLFLPGVPLFPMKRRDGAIETDRAPEPPEEMRWAGPVAAFVDPDTASAAEMIAGGLTSYRRGPSVGLPTFGKGCAQEYLDDVAHLGILRLTTLLYSLPDGSAVQRVGLTPTHRFAFVQSAPSGESPLRFPIDREALLPQAPPTWAGPDVRDWSRILGHDPAAGWPTHNGTLGPCKEAAVCRALRLLGGKRIAATTKRH